MEAESDESLLKYLLNAYILEKWYALEKTTL